MNDIILIAATVFLGVVQTGVLAIAGWTLLEVIAQGKTVAVLQQKLRDLPCGDCEIKNEQP